MRLLTRSDFDGLACGVLLKAAGLIESWKFVHPKDMQDGLVEIKPSDILCNVPYAEGCKMWFDHHSSEEERAEQANDSVLPYSNTGSNSEPVRIYKAAPSAARLVYEYFGGDTKFTKYKDMINNADKVDSGRLTKDEIQNPQGWILIGFLLDPRTGLGRFRGFRLANFEFVDMLIQACVSSELDEILKIPDVAERIEFYNKQTAKFKEMLLAHTEQKANVIVTDLRGVQPIHTGNRFLIYSLFPEANVSVWLVDGHSNQTLPIAVGHSILNRSCKTDIGSLMLRYGGGGHKQVGTCQVALENADSIVSEIVSHLKD